MYGGVQIDTPDIRRALEQLVAGLISQRLWHDDLVQEAWVHWWMQERRCPRQSRAWYLRSCEFFLRNQMRHGRSIDSPKRRIGSLVSMDDEAGRNGLLEVLADTTEAAAVRGVVMARDFQSALRPKLSAVEWEILGCLVDGLGARETARRLHLSHTCVANKRRRIADCLLEISGDGPLRPHGWNTAPARKKPFPIAP